MLFSISKFSEMTGIDRRTISRRLSSMKPEKVGRSNLYDSVRALPMLFLSEDDRLDPQQEKALLDRERRRIIELDRAEKEGDLVNVESVRDEWSALITTAKSHLLSIPSHLAPDLVSIEKSKQIESLLRDAVNEALQSVADDVRSQ